eukprot:TRINITY_DN6379_c0_g6_i2.p1 TRINITY_DN6379_c0_g6~~TRINITY_DN6379_c0_g6_i2.p1  ORF type:complete len:184 (-),score=60.41 TRINITY_DN6379_c0_g6_i2:140-691(-)
MCIRDRYMDTGKLVPDELIFGMIDIAISKPGCGKIMFDGFPRTLEQAKRLDDMLRRRNKKLVALIYLNVPDSELLERGIGRRVHLPSGRSYHMRYKPPKVEGKDDVTGEELIQRDDDKEETIRKRLETFHANNEKILEHYKEQDVVFEVEANDKIDIVWEKVVAILDKVMAGDGVAEPEPKEK